MLVASEGTCDIKLYPVIKINICRRNVEPLNTTALSYWDKISDRRTCFVALCPAEITKQELSVVLKWNQSKAVLLQN